MDKYPSQIAEGFCDGFIFVAKQVKGFVTDIFRHKLADNIFVTDLSSVANLMKVFVTDFLSVAKSLTRNCDGILSIAKVSDGYFFRRKLSNSSQQKLYPY